MSKPKSLKGAVQSALSLTVEPVSIRDAGSQAARAGDSLERVARWCAAHIADFPSKVSKPDRAAFKDGVFVHYQTVKPAQYYRREGKNMVRLEDKPAKFGPEHLTLDVAFCTSLTGQQFGGLKTTDPEAYKEIAVYRDDCNKYAGNRFAAVVSCHKRLTAEPRPRGATEPFKDRMAKLFDSMAKSAKVAKDSRGDVTAPTPEQFKAAVKAFWTTLAS